MTLLLAMAGLMAMAEPPAPAVVPSDADRMNQVVCRRDTETGSLVRVRKVCHTRAEWQSLDSQNRDAATRLVDDSRSRPNGPN